jgi:opacity protein-like surface antigen
MCHCLWRIWWQIKGERKMLKKLCLAVSFLACCQSAFAADAEDEFVKTKELTQIVAVEGCVMGIVDAAAKDWMKRAATDGKQYANLEEAKQEMTAYPVWKKEVDPALHTMCECLMGEYIARVKSTKNLAELTSLALQFAESMKTTQHQEMMAKRAQECTESSGIDQILGKKPPAQVGLNP